MNRLLWLVLCCPLLLGAASRSFDGTNDQIGWGDSFDISPSATYCLWVKMTEDASVDCLDCKSTGIANFSYAFFQASGDLITFRVEENSASGGSVISSTTTTDVDGAWAFVCGEFDNADDSTAVYVNGVQEDSDVSGSAIGTITGSAVFTNGEDTSATNDANGLMAYSLVCSTAILSATEIIEVMWHPSAMACNGFMPLWGDSTEINIQNTAITGTVSWAGTSTDGPPTMVGGYLPL